MNNRSLLVLAGLFLCSACGTMTSLPIRTTDATMATFLPELNKKVAGYLEKNPTAALDRQTYKEIVDKVCSPLPECGEKAALMYATYSVQARKLNTMFSVMLCDKYEALKIMEDFSCNESTVEIVSYQDETMTPCMFEAKWKTKVASLCSSKK
jgi:hypothetical protein